MTTRQTRSAELAAIEDAFERLGADMARWPQGERTRFSALIARDPAARRLQQEANALEALLENVPAGRPERLAALTDRIVAQAVSEAARTHAGRGAAGGGDRVVAFEPRRKVASAATLPRPAAWRVASLLAASLLLGVFIGTSAASLPGLGDLAEAVGLSDSDTPRVALVDLDGDEDLL